MAGQVEVEKAEKAEKAEAQAPGMADSQVPRKARQWVREQRQVVRI